jgi:murein DD-endopeptidase MepM/ murein hydrolase activator NlpD
MMSTGLLPITGRISSPFGWRIHPVLKTRKFHNGIDIAAKQGTPLPTLWAGKVLQAGDTGAGGNTVTIDAGADGQGRAIRYSYCHLHQIKVKVGQEVTAGQIVGTVGSTGRSTGPHLHYTLRVNGEAVDPQTFTWAEASPPADPPALVVSGEKLPGQLTEDGRLIVPARSACALLGLPCIFVPPAALNFGGMYQHGRLIDETLYVAARELCERAGKTATWDNESKQLVVS